MDRDRVSALLASVGDDPPWQVCRQLLTEYDKALASTEIWRQTAASANERADKMEVELGDAEADCARLVAHIVAHPSGDYQTVLTLHDQRKQ